VVSRGRAAWSSSATSWLLLVLLVALVLVPSANFALFSGIPLASRGEFIAALLLAPLVLSATARKRWRQLLGMARPSPARVVALVAALALVAKVILFVSGAYTGFLACYRSLSSTPVRGCEHSYADPLSRFGSTRSDRTIDFGPQGLHSGDSSSVGTNPWNLDFFNSLRFNFTDRQPGVPYRDFLPFFVRWTGDVSGRTRRGLVVRYVGEGSIRVDKRRIVLPPSYRTAAKRSFGVPPGRHAIVVEYRFARKVLQPQPFAGPYAQIAIHGADGTVLRSAPPAIGWRLLAIFADAITIALLAVAGLVFLTVLRGRLLLAGACAALTTLALKLPHGALSVLEWGLFMLVVWSIARRRWSTGTALLTAYFCLAAIELVRAHHDFHPFDQVSYPKGGTDYLTYESQAHEVLAGSLRGGESTFVYAPAFRYLLAGGHALFGNGNARLSLVAMLALTFAVFAFGVACVLGYPPSPRQGTWNWSIARSQVVWKAGACVAVGATLLLVTNPLVVQMVRNPQSEFPTWILVAVALFLALHVRRRPAFLVAALLAGVALTTRFDQGIGLIFLLLCGAAALWRRERPDARSWRVAVIAAVVVFAAIALLPAIHNVHYGGKFVVLPQTPGLPVNFPLPPARLIRVCCDASVRATLINQLKGVTVRGVPASDWLSGVTAGFDVVVTLLQLVWLASLVALGVNWRRSNPTMRLVAALPLAFLVPFIFLQVYVYYPRHVVVGYLVMGLAAAFVLGELGRRNDPTASLRAEGPVTEAASTSTTT
jgi:hypothetical protein